MLSPDRVKSIGELFNSLGYETFPAGNGAPRVFVVRDEGEKTYGSTGILRPDTSEYKPARGTVLMVGADREGNTPAHIKVGDRVAFSRYQNTTIRFRVGEDEFVVGEMLHINDIYLRWPPGGVAEAE